MKMKRGLRQIFQHVLRPCWRTPAVSALLLAAFLLGWGQPALAEEKFCSDYPNGVIDGNVDPVPVQITIDRDCTFQNFPASNPLTGTLNFQTNDPSIYLIIFNNVIFTGHMACANVEHRIWFANGSDYGSSNSCQDLFIPVESIDKRAPGPVATIGEPFTYTLTFPSMTLVGGPSLNDLHSVTLWDDLNATGADLTFVSLNAYRRSTGEPVTLEPETNPLAPGGVWTEKNLSYKPYAEILPAGEQLIVEITVVPDNTPANAAGRTFVNTAKWSFGRLIEGVFYEPLPGEWGISEPMTIAEPNLIVNKTSSDTAVNLGVPATFTIDVQNVGGSEAWQTTIIDQLPAEMCSQDPSQAPGFSAQIVEADGSTAVALIANSDFTTSFSGDPACTLSIDLQTDRAQIGPLQHLVVTYQAQLDGDVTADGLDLVNIAGATQWFSADPTSGADFRTFNRTLTDGTPTVVDHQDSQVVTTALSGYYFQKTVENLNTGANPASAASPGDRLRYRVRLFNVDETITDVTIRDTLDLSRFDPATFALTTLPPDTAYTFNPATGLLQISGNPAPLDIPVGGELILEFEINLLASLSNQTRVSNQANLTAAGLNALSDDPTVNGISPPDGDPPPDPTVVVIQTPGPLTKANTQVSSTIGEQFQYTITVPATPLDVPLYDVRVADDLTTSGAEMRFIEARVVSGGSWALSNIGTATQPILADTVTGIDIPANGQVEIAMTVALVNTASNQDGRTFNNTASYTYNRINGNDTTRQNGEAGSTGNMTVVEPLLVGAKSVRFVSPAGKPVTDPAVVGDVLEYTITVVNNGRSTAFDTSMIDALPANVSLVTASATAQLSGTSVAGFVVEPTVRLDGTLAWGQDNGDGTLDIPVGESLVLTYQVTVDAITGPEITNNAYIAWTSLDGTNPSERTGDGCPVITAPNDYCSGPVSTVVTSFDDTAIVKSVSSDSFAEVPASTTNPVVRVGDTVTYDLQLSLHEFLTQNVVVEDVLPEGMAFESFTILGGTEFSYTLSEQPSAGQIGTLRWNFGDVTNPPSNDQTPIDTLVIRYVVRVLTNDPPEGVPHIPSIQRDNQAQLSYANGDPAAFPGRLTTTQTIDVRQPLMSPLSKIDRGGGRTGSGTSADPYQINLASDVMNFQLSSCNEGLAPAYEVVLTDQLASEFDEGDLVANPPVVTVGPRTLAAGTDYAYAAPGRGGTMRFALAESAAVLPGECLNVTYDIGFHTDLTTSSTWSNQARLESYWSRPTSQPGRQYVPNDLAEVWLTNLINEEQLLKTLISPAEATIGDDVVYQIRVPALPMNQALNNVVVTDTLHEALTYVSTTAVNGNGETVSLVDRSVAPGQVVLDVGTIPAGEQVLITLTTRVANNDQVNAGLRLTNTASYSFAGMPPDLVTASTSGPLTIIEPSIAIAKTVANVSRPGLPPTAGDRLRYSITFTASGGAAGDDFANAYDLRIEDSLSVGLVYQAGTSRVDDTNNAIADPIVTGDGSDTAQSLSWNLADGNADIDVTEGTTVTVTYETLVLDQVVAGQALTNSAVCQWTSQDAANPFERTGSGEPPFNDYFAGPATTSQITEIDVSFSKEVFKVVKDDNGNVVETINGDQAIPGDTLRYRLVITNQSIAPLTNAILTDALAAQFAPGTLEIVDVIPTDVDTSQTDPLGGSNDAGIIDIRGIDLAPDASLTIVFEARLEPVIQSGTLVLNRAQLSGDNLSNATSNETATRITSAPVFDVWKTSADVTGDADTLLPGDTLRYTLTVKNIGNENAVNSVLRDQAPANTTYLPNSTTLNGNSVADLAGESPLQNGLLIHAPEDATAGSLRADPDSTSPGNVATVTFDVVINSDVVDGTVIANQGAFNADGTGSGPVSEEPSDDPDTPVLDDPTRDVVGSLPLVDAQKTVTLVNQGSDVDSVVNPGDTLRYTITIVNTGQEPASQVVFSDPIPAYTTFVPGSVQLNGTPVNGQFDGTVLTFDVSSSDQPAPVQGRGEGVLSAQSSAEISFAVLVNDNPVTGPVPDPGTIISNQGVVRCDEQPDEPTDADGIDTNGDQPTQVVVGDVPQLSILKEVSVVDGTTAEPGLRLEYRVRVTNIGSQPATNVLISDDLGALMGQVSYLDSSATLNGSRAGVNDAGAILTAVLETLPLGEQAVLAFQVRIAATVAPGTTITNTAEVTWDTAPRPESARISIDVGGTPGSAVLNGTVWHDADLDSFNDDTETDLEGWSVSLYRSGQQLATVQTDSSGRYRLSGLDPAGSPYELRFRAAGAGPDTPSLGMTSSPFTDGPQQIRDILATAGSNLQNLDLPITPNGVVYDSVTGSAVAGTMITLQRAATETPLSEQCFADPLQQNQVTAADGFYKFDLTFGHASCPPGEAYYIALTPPASGYEPGASQILKAGVEVAGSVIGGDPNDPGNIHNNQTIIPFSVPTCPGSPDDALPATADLCEVSTSAMPAPAGAGGTTYYLTLTLADNRVPGDSQAFNNHLPVDPVLDGAVTITKTSPLINVSKGQLVPYTITVSNKYDAPLYDLSIVDMFPAGFKYVADSARLNGLGKAPRMVGQQLLWDDIDLGVDEQQTLQFLLVVGAGVTEGKYINRAQAINTVTQRSLSNVATATVRVVPDPTFDCTDVIGKVFDDQNLNGQQDPNELGLPGVQVVSARGLISTTDQHGRFHITCAMVPDEDRGSNFILKLDDHTLPTGYRLTTENPRVQRATRGKMMKFNFGATVHRVVGLDCADGVFEPDRTELRVQWRAQLRQLVEELKKAPSTLRLSYLADVEGESLVEDRIEALRDEISRLWDLAGGDYPLTVETEVFWRRGGPR
ncbi:MAG: isopeptide-forming domain-containing fimbrial protein [Desulfuromonadales bacterium]